MRVVLYADDMEPITVIDLPAIAKSYLDARGVVRVAVMLPPLLSVLAATQPPTQCDCKTVTIISERFVRNGVEHMMLFTNDEESAMLLKCAFLPGQLAGLQERERAAFARGFVKALTCIGSA